MTGRLEGKVAFITGAARGQGRAHAVKLASEGADIVGLDICGQIDSVDYPMSTPEDLQETVELVEKHGRRMIAGAGDVRDIESLRALYAEGEATFGHVDLVVANAGIMPIWGRDSDTMLAWQDSLDVMLTGVLHTVETAYPRLLEQGTGGSIVLTGSMAALKPMMRTLGGRTLGGLGYSAAKAAVVNLAQNYASILAAHHIRVNVVHPTGVNTPMTDNPMVHERFGTIDPDDKLAVANAMPVRFVEPQDIADAVAFLCSDEARFVTGAELRVDAGSRLR
ncbi:mycofactocin-coupled SDR family oxidoreductase [Pseudonocardia ailaonensis]|uniref:Mycofactocin-coupled SDR family oxidoreductase n=1 Tax=Pseudonocardia ailaonensis TaxID=367279 RepID=A0ABN2MZQ1_9PSEU